MKASQRKFILLSPQIITAWQCGQCAESCRAFEAAPPTSEAFFQVNILKNGCFDPTNIVFDNENKYFSG